MVSAGFLSILAVMAVAGAFGGYAGFLLGPNNPSGELAADERAWLLRRSVVAGVVASFTVPLFLSLAGAASGANDQLVDRLVGAQLDYGAWLILIGFCLIASVSAPNFISAVSERVLQDIRKEAKAASAKAEEARQDLENLESEIVNAARVQIQPVSDDAKLLLREVYQNDERRPSLEDVQKAAIGLPLDRIERALDELEAEGLVRSRLYDNTKRWRVRTAGKAYLGSIQAKG